MNDPKKPILAELVEPFVAFEKKSFVEQILSPQTLQRMMLVSGGVLVLGLVGWLWSIGLFKDPEVVAVLMGVTTLAVLGGGIALVRFTRYQLAGTGLTLLASLAMPLNLWFYDAQGLITLANGGHLWIPAAICCVIYALVARVLRNPVFVYALLGGIVMTGMLFLADHAIGHFWELMPHVTFLVTIGWACVFGEQLFHTTEGDFSRDKFGQAFYRSGIAIMLGGLCLLLGGQLASIVPNHFYLPALPLIATDAFQKMWGLAILGSCTAGFTIQAAIRKPRWPSVVATLMVGGWSAACLLDVLHIQPKVPMIATLAGIVITVIALVGRKRLINDSPNSFGLELRSDLMLLASMSLVTLGAVQFVAQFTCGVNNLFFMQTHWLVALQLIVTGIACWATFGWLAAGNQPRGTLFDKDFLLGLGSVMAALSAFTVSIVLEVYYLDVMAMIGFALPIGFTACQLRERNEATRKRLASIAAVSLTSALGCLTIYSFTNQPVPFADHLSWAGISGVAAALYLLSWKATGQVVEWILGYAAAVVALCQLMTASGLSFDYALTCSANVSRHHPGHGCRNSSSWKWWTTLSSHPNTGRGRATV